MVIPGVGRPKPTSNGSPGSWPAFRPDVEIVLARLESLIGGPAHPKPNGPARRWANGAERTCPGCDAGFQPKNATQRYCSGRCRRAHWARQREAQTRQERRPPSDPEPAPAAATTTIDGALAAAGSCSVGLNAVLKRRIGRPPGEFLGIDEQAITEDAARDARFAAAGLRGLPAEVIERRLARCEPVYAKAVRALL